MTEKFTEKQYQEIVETQEKNFFNNVLTIGSNHKYFYDSLKQELKSFIFNNDLEEKAFAIFNPLTREWAHGQFVEKEKKYYWKSKKKDEDGDHIIIYKEVKYGGLITDFENYYGPDPLTESEIREWGYNPDMFDREEVE